MLIPVGEWRPDLPDFMNGGSLTMKNVFPAPASARPFPGFLAFSGAAGARVQGAWAGQDSSQNAMTFAGDATKLYKQGLAGALADVSRAAGGAYAIGADGQWRFAEFQTAAVHNLVAVNGVDAVQAFDLDAGSLFAALSATAPIAAHAATSRDFLFLGNIAGSPTKIQWSPQGNPGGTWGTDPATLADFQILADGGPINGLVGGEYVLCLQAEKVLRLSFAGPPLAWQIDPIARSVGATIPGSVASWGNLAFFCHRSGFYMTVAGQQVIPIGDEKVDRFFWSDLDQTYLARVTSAIDATNGVYAICYHGQGNAGNADTMLLYNWVIQRWAYAKPGDLEMIYAAVSQTGLTLDNLDDYNPLPNLVTRTQEIDNAAWTKTRSSAVADSTTDPDGGTNADTLVEDATAAATHTTSQSVAKAATSITYTLSWYLKQSTRTAARVQAENAAATGTAFVDVNLATGVIFASGVSGAGFAVVSTSITAASNGFYRVVLTFTSDADTAAVARLLIANPVGTVSYNGNGASGIFAYGAQLQAGLSVTTYNPVKMTVDALPYSLDSSIWVGIARPLFGGASTSHNLGYFNGDNLAAVVDTTEAQIIDGQRAVVRALRPMVDGGTPTVAIGTRQRIEDAVSFGTAVAMNAQGRCRFRARGRFHRARITVPAASTWSHIQGVGEIEAHPSGWR